MKKALLPLAVAASLVAPPARPAAASEMANPLFAETHLLPSPFTMKAGRLVYGTDIALGVTDFLQLSTNVIYDIYQTYNASAKLALLDNPDFAFGLRATYQTYNLHNYSLSNPDATITSVLPGATLGVALAPTFAVFLGGNLNFTNLTTPSGGIDTSGYVHGAEAGADLSWAYSPGKKKLGNVLSAGVTYDFTYSIYGVGVSHHWPGFHLGIHYYPNATDYRVLPIIAGGGSVDL